MGWKEHEKVCLKLNVHNFCQKNCHPTLASYTIGVHYLWNTLSNKP